MEELSGSRVEPRDSVLSPAPSRVAQVGHCFCPGFDNWLITSFQEPVARPPSLASALESAVLDTGCQRLDCPNSLARKNLQVAFLPALDLKVHISFCFQGTEAEHLYTLQMTQACQDIEFEEQCLRNLGQQEQDILTAQRDAPV